MNERLKELIDQCINERLIQYDGGGEYVEVFDKEKFAELIVRECAKVGGDFEYARLHDSLVEDHILKHFGVEE
jgi:hypothetical protein